VPDEPSILVNEFSRPRQVIKGVRIIGRLPTASARAEQECAIWLRELIPTYDRPPAKADVFKEAKQRFPGLSRGRFDEVWRAEVPEPWTKGGPRRRNPRT